MFCIHTVTTYIYIQQFMVTRYTKTFVTCFNSEWFLFTNHVTNVLTEVVPYCKSGHNYIYIYIYIYIFRTKLQD